MHNMFRSFLYVLALGCAACSSGGGTAAEPKAQAAPADQIEYHIGPGDKLNIFVFNQPDLSIEVPS